MNTLFFGDKTILFTNSSNRLCDKVVELNKSDTLTITKMLEIVENCKHLCIISPTPEEAFELFCANFREVFAAGGVVKNQREQVLMILRNGRWDLPKGHIEQGEYTNDAAEREVMEETGVSDLVVGDLITATHHIYQLNTEWVLKRTIWLAFQSRGDAPLTPQREEGIERVEWVERDSVENYTRDSFPLVRYLLSRADALELAEPFEE